MRAVSAFAFKVRSLCRLCAAALCVNVQYVRAKVCFCCRCVAPIWNMSTRECANAWRNSVSMVFDHRKNGPFALILFFVFFANQDFGQKHVVQKMLKHL